MENRRGGTLWVDDLIKDAEKTIRRSKKYIRGLPKEQQELIGLLTGKLVGDKVNEIYESRSPDEKLLWEQIRPVHHGDVGYVVAEDGRKKRDSLLVGLGKGLMLSDIKDRDEWVHPKLVGLKKRKVARKR